MSVSSLSPSAIAGVLDRYRALGESERRAIASALYSGPELVDDLDSVDRWIGYYAELFLSDYDLDLTTVAGLEDVGASRVGAFVPG